MTLQDKMIAFAKDHGNNAYAVDNGAIVVESKCAYRDGTVTVETDICRNVKELRAILGY